MTHYLKCGTVPYQAIVAEKKRCEIRVNDRLYGVGDTLYLKEIDPVRGFTGEMCHVRVLHIDHGPAWGLPDNLVVMSVELKGVEP